MSQTHREPPVLIGLVWHEGLTLTFFCRSSLSKLRFNLDNLVFSLLRVKMADEEYETTESAASDTRPAQCSTLRKGGHVVIKGHPCKIVDMSTSKTGKHGHAKVHLVALDIFTGKKYEDLCPSTHNMSVPEVSRNDYQVKIPYLCSVRLDPVCDCA